VSSIEDFTSGSFQETDDTTVNKADVKTLFSLQVNSIMTSPQSAKITDEQM
jgi:hypothetical protein